MKLFKPYLFFTLFSIFALFTFFGATKAFAGTDDNLYGTAWSSNIGWIKMNNCTSPDPTTCIGADYGVNIETSGAGLMTGRAWSSNLGWISFDSSATVNCDSLYQTNNTCQAFADWSNPAGDGTVEIKGFARACSVFASGCSGALKSDLERGGWDGYIALGDTGSPVPFGVKINASNALQGRAWGDVVTGWVDFSGVSIGQAPNSASVTLSLAEACVLSGGNATLNWSSVGTTTCTSPDFNTGNQTSGSIVVNPTSTTTYNISCNLIGGGTTPDSVTVPVSSTCNTNPKFIQSFGANDCVDNLGDSASLMWSATAANSCSIRRGNDASTTQNNLPNAAAAFSPNATVNADPTAYTLTCTNGGGQTDSEIAYVSVCNGVIDPPPGGPDFEVVALSTEGTTHGQLIDGVGAFLGKKAATFTVTIDPSGGFTDPVNISTNSNLAVPNMPPGLLSALSQTTLNHNGSQYNTATFTVYFEPTEVSPNTVWTPIRVTGTSGTLSDQEDVSVGARRRIRVIEF